MMVSLNPVPNPPETGDARLRCGDCQADVPRPAGQPTHTATDPDHYCPYCAKPVLTPLECNHCGSTICPRCGALLELADELGIG
jgi:DNA-directed RNA polymerase subunit RPC12/RpoP